MIVAIVRRGSGNTLLFGDTKRKTHDFEHKFITSITQSVLFYSPVHNDVSDNLK